ncbi:hypothetical protein HanRHA438_Chr12g0545111 [Helianthus annuus]|nr:hypothetical protein HanIR_Chr11g0545871 [Helianthus annuus]KAJ0865857.1 hypothetical protein HanRHA438_Chr12g0545111 [Helianthus annuus]
MDVYALKRQGHTLYVLVVRVWNSWGFFFFFLVKRAWQTLNSWLGCVEVC